jgi:hypothetical protein
MIGFVAKEKAPHCGAFLLQKEPAYQVTVNCTVSL